VEHVGRRIVVGMSMTFSTTPTADQLRRLDTAELALILLGSLDDPANVNNILRGHEHAHGKNGEPDAERLMQRVSDAWAWLVANGLIGPHHKQTSSEWYRVTERGTQVDQFGERAPDPRRADAGKLLGQLFRHEPQRNGSRRRFPDRLHSAGVADGHPVRSPRDLDPLTPPDRQVVEHRVEAVQQVRTSLKAVDHVGKPRGVHTREGSMAIAPTHGGLLPDGTRVTGPEAGSERRMALGRTLLSPADDQGAGLRPPIVSRERNRRP
jgi:hypothetical protein